MSVRETIASVLMLVGVGFNFLAALGLLRFPGTLARMHAATKSVTLGLLCVLVGSAVAIASIGAATQLLLVVGLQFITAPLAAHMIGRAVYRTYEEARSQLSVDELDSHYGSESLRNE